MDTALSILAIERDWAAFAAQCARLGLGQPTRTGIEVFVPLVPVATTDRFLAVLSCDDYDLIAPLLDFADPDQPGQRGGPHWPKMADAPMNSVAVHDTTVPIVCTPGTRGYHLHSSHSAEQHPRSTWSLPRVAALLWHLTQNMGPYQGRGV